MHREHIYTYYSSHCCQFEAGNTDAVGYGCLPPIPAKALLQAEQCDSKVPPRAPLVSIVLAIVLQGLQAPFINQPTRASTPQPEKVRQVSGVWPFQTLFCIVLLLLVATWAFIYVM